MVESILGTQSTLVYSTSELMKKINLRKLNLRIFKRLPAREKRITIPTMFTIGRIALTPFIVGSMVGGFWGFAIFLFVLSALTDIIDGTLARIRGEKTFLGACLDPIADKFLILSCFFTLAFVDTPLFDIPQWFVLLVLGKEIIQLTGASILYYVKGHLDVRPTMLGKMTTVVQMGFIVWLFACYFFQWLPLKTYYTMLGVLVLLVFASLAQYMQIGVRAFRVPRDE